MSERGCFTFVVLAALFTTALIAIVLFDFVRPTSRASTYDFLAQEDILARIEKQTELNATNKALTGNQLLADIARGIAYLRYQLVKMNESLQIQQQLPSNDRNRSQEESTKYIASDYFAVHAGGGLGNILFEFISVIGIARSVGRKPYIDATNYVTIGKLHDLNSVFPNMAKYFLIRFPSTSRVNIAMTSGKCCVYNGIGEIIRNSDAPDIFLKDVYLQSFKYFRNISDEIRSSILFLSESISKIGRNGLLGGVSLSTTNHRLCVHIRRGDFIASSLHMESRENFTVWAVRHVIDEKLKGENVTVILFGNDRIWSLKITEKYFNSTRMQGYVTNTISSTTPAVDFAFVRHNCDSVILTASASTFGWWSAFLAGPQKNIYYNSVFSKPNGVERELNATDFFLPEWIPLTMPSDFMLPPS